MMGAIFNCQSERQAMPQSAVPRTADRALGGFLASCTGIVARVPAFPGRSRNLHDVLGWGMRAAGHWTGIAYIFMAI